MEKLISRFKQMFGCDSARISNPLGDTMFLIIGNKRNTKDDAGVWRDQHGNVKNWDYINEFVIASGKTEKELIKSAKEYKKLLGMSWPEYFEQERTLNLR